MKRIVCILLCCTFFVAFAGCGKKADTEATVKPVIENVLEVPMERIAPKQVEPASSFAGGDGSEQSPYQISSAGELALLAKIFNGTDADHYKIADYAGKNYVLTADIIINSKDEMKQAKTKAPTFAWTPIGQNDTKTGKGEDFQGVFDGGNHSISGLYIITDFNNVTGTGANVGLFAQIKNAKIKNVTVSDSYFYSYNQINAIASLAGTSYRVDMENCHSDNCVIYSNVAQTGGLVGEITGAGNMVNCSADGTVESNTSGDVGGIIAKLSDGTMEKCVNQATVISHKGTAGGICAVVSDSAKQKSWEKSDSGAGKTVLKGCENNGKVVAENGRCGGIAASILSANSSITISACRNSGEVFGSVKAGGISSEFASDKNYIDKNADNQGAILVEKCENSGSIKSNGACAGIVGSLSAENESNITVRECVNSIGNTIFVSKPTGLKCIARSTTAEKVAWNEVSGASGYQVQCSDGGTRWAQSKSGTATSALFRGLSAGGKYKFRVRAYAVVNGTKYYSAWSSTLCSCAKPATVTIKGVSSPKHTQIKTTWAKAGGTVSGYQIYYGKNASFTSLAAKKNVSGKSTISYTGKNFTKGKTYYVKVRTYTVFNGVTYYGAWSATKKVKTK